MKGNAAHYRNLLAALEGALDRICAVLDGHEACFGCQLCRDCAGMEYTLLAYRDAIASDEPPAEVLPLPTAKGRKRKAS